MAGKLRDYQVLDVFCGGTFYKVRHKVTNKIFSWKAYNCSAYSDEQIHIIGEEVKIVRKVVSDKLLRYYDTILHAPSKTLYFVLEFSSWRNVQELIEECQAVGKHIAEDFVWHLLHELAQVCKAVEDINLVVLRKCIAASSIFVGVNGELRINCFDLKYYIETTALMSQVGDVIHRLCYQTDEYRDTTKSSHYSDDLRDVIDFLTDNKNCNLRPDVVLYHPTVLANLETLSRPKILSEIIVAEKASQLTSESNKCDAEKAVELSRALEPVPRTRFNIPDSPIYCNISPRKKRFSKSGNNDSKHVSLSPSLAALALELPGFVPRCRKPYTEILNSFKSPKQVSEEIFSQQWMSRLIALREREDSLNKRERDLVVKEIVNSPSTKIVNLNSCNQSSSQDSNGITLPPIITQSKHEKQDHLSHRHRSMFSSVRPKSRRKSYSYEDLDSSLSADAGDGSMVITATKFTAANMPRRIIFPDVSSKKVHFTSSNPFTDSDESVTLTFYELENIDGKENHSSRQENISNDISKFKYLNSDNLVSDRKSRLKWNHLSPTKQVKITKDVFGGNTCMRKTPSKLSINSQCSTSSRYSMISRSQCSVDLSDKISAGSISARTRSKQSMAQTPTAPPDIKKSKSRKSLLHFKTPFKFRSSTKPQRKTEA